MKVKGKKIKILKGNTTWVLSDKTKGMENQSIALASILNNNFKLIHYTPPYFLKKFPILGKIYTPKFLQEALRTNSLPDFVITTGRRMAGTSIALKSILKSNVKTIHIQNPKLSLNNFDLLLIPEHDNVKGKNVIQTKGALSFLNKNDIKKFEKSKLNKIKVKNNLVLLMVGGNSKSFKPQSSEYYDLCINVIKAIKSIDGQLIVIISRRTPTKAIKIFKSIFSKHLSNFQIFSPNENKLYPQILQIIDYIIVTSDSVNMISEMATLSRPLFISHFSKENKKISLFIKNLRKLKIVKTFEGDLYEYSKNKLQTNKNTLLQINKFFRFE